MTTRSKRSTAATVRRGRAQCQGGTDRNPSQEPIDPRPSLEDYRGFRRRDRARIGCRGRRSQMGRTCRALDPAGDRARVGHGVPGCHCRERRAERYVGTVLPAIIVFGLGLSLTVAPLTATVLAAAPARHAGVASGINNAISRGAGLIAVAVVPGLAGLTGEACRGPGGFRGRLSRRHADERGVMCRRRRARVVADKR
jgi:hypothetical protein